MLVGSEIGRINFGKASRACVLHIRNFSRAGARPTSEISTNCSFTTRMSQNGPVKISRLRNKAGYQIVVSAGHQPQPKSFYPITKIAAMLAEMILVSFGQRLQLALKIWSFPCLAPKFCDYPSVHPARGAIKVAMGTVKWFNPTKGFGFIQPDNGGKDVFVHISAVEKAGLSDLAEGAKVSYEIIADRGKESAGNLRVV
jgi:cold shock protein